MGNQLSTDRHWRKIICSKPSNGKCWLLPHSSGSIMYIYIYKCIYIRVRRGPGTCNAHTHVMYIFRYITNKYIYIHTESLFRNSISMPRKGRNDHLISLIQTHHRMLPCLLWWGLSTAGRGQGHASSLDRCCVWTKSVLDKG